MAAGRSAASAPFTPRVTPARSPTSSSSRATAAVSTVLPQRAASTTAMESSGSHSRRQLSLKVPVPELPAGVPQSMPRILRRLRKQDLARPFSLRRSRSISFSVASCVSLSRRAVAVRSASNGVRGTSSGTSPSSSPTIASRVTRSRARSFPSHSTARVASCTSGSPGMGRPRSTARASASRMPSMTCADEVGRSCSRSTAPTWVSQRSTGRSGAANRWWYQPGERTPAPYPEEAASLPWDHGTQVS